MISEKATNKVMDKPDSFLKTELVRIDLLLREQVRLAQNREGFWKRDNLRGLYISDSEINTALADVHLTDAIGSPSSKMNNKTSRVNAGEETREFHQSDSRLRNIIRLFNLSDFEKDVLLLCLLPELDLSYERFFGYIQDDVTRRKPSVQMALNVLCPPAESIPYLKSFSRKSTLIDNFLVSVEDEPPRRNSPLLARSLKLDDRIRDFLLGFDNIDSNLLPFSQKKIPEVDYKNVALPQTTKTNLLNLLEDVSKRHSTVIYFRGATGTGKKSTADALCKQLGLVYLLVDTPDLVEADIPVENSIIRIFREACLQQLSVFFASFDILFENKHQHELKTIYRIFNRTFCCPGPVFLAGIDSPRFGDEFKNKIFVAIEFPELDYQKRKEIWQNYLGDHTVKNTLAASALSSKFKINMGQIARSVYAARNRAVFSNGGKVNENDLFDTCRQVSNCNLSELAQKIITGYSWEDIVLPEEQLKQLREISGYVRYRHIVYGEWGFDRKNRLGKGLNILFAGPSGTGKTMAAAILANDLKLDLYKIDLSAIVSKYIGETEKNLSRIFREAQDSNSILFFDEADSLFGKRSEVKDSHDRYANIEIAYLLQKMEECEGIVILATNLGKNIDEAFARRMHFSIEFPFPDENQRLLIWRMIFPQNAPLSEKIDLQFMSRQFKISGGNIKNVAVAAAFLAASEKEKINMEHLILATKREYQKIGRLCTAAEFGCYFEKIKGRPGDLQI